MKVSKKDLISLIIIFLITLVIFYNFVTMHYATDTYNIINVGYEKYAVNWSLNDGRVFMCLLGLFANAVNMHISVFVIFTLVVAILVSCIAVIVLKNLILKYKKTENKYIELIVFIIAYFTIFNFMYIENMYFVESIVMALSLLLYIISANILVNRNKYYLIKSLLLTILAIFMYQGIIGFFFAITFIFSLLKENNKIKDNIRDVITSGVIAGLRHFI